MGCKKTYNYQNTYNILFKLLLKLNLFNHSMILRQRRATHGSKPHR